MQERTHLRPKLTCSFPHIWRQTGLSEPPVCLRQPPSIMLSQDLHYQRALHVRCPRVHCCVLPWRQHVEAPHCSKQSSGGCRFPCRPELEVTVQARLDSMAGRRVGYLKLKSFTARTQPDVAAAVRHLQVLMIEYP